MLILADVFIFQSEIVNEGKHRLNHLYHSWIANSCDGDTALSEHVANSCDGDTALSKHVLTVIYIYIYFSDVSTLFFMVLLRRSRRFDLLLHLYGGTLQHTFLHFFQKSNFQKFFGPFPRAAGAFAHHFRIPLLRYITSNFFRRFYPIFHGLTPALPTFRLTFILPSSR